MVSNKSGQVMLDRWCPLQIPAVQDFGDITDIKIMFDPDTHSSRGFGFVNFTKASSALEAVSRMHGSSFEGKRLYAAINESNRIRMGKPGAGKSDFVGTCVSVQLLQGAVLLPTQWRTCSRKDETISRHM